jgi:hypothetical protein
MWQQTLQHKCERYNLKISTSPNVSSSFNKYCDKPEKSLKWQHTSKGFIIVKQIKLFFIEA